MFHEALLPSPRAKTSNRHEYTISRGDSPHHAIILSSHLTQSRKIINANEYFGSGTIEFLPS
jgi:hypothetical protein